MSTVSTSIQLHDRVSSTINNIVSAIENVCSAFESVEQSMDGGFDASAIDSARAALSDAVFEADKLGDEIDKNARSQDKFTDEIEESTSEMGMLAKVASGIGVYFGLSELKNQVATAINYASDLEEVQNVVDTAFGSSAKTVNEWSKTTLKAFGLNELSAKNYAGTMGAMLKSSGLASDEIVNMSMELTELAGDMASFRNLSGEEAFNKIRSGISGETEPLKAIGIDMSVASLEAYALSQGIETAYNEMSQAEKVMLRYNYLLKATSYMQGDFTDTAGSFSNQAKVLKESWTEFTGSLATYVLPTLTSGINVLNKAIGFMANNWSILAPILALVGTCIALVNAPLIAQAGLWLWNSVLVPIYTAVVGFLSHGYNVLTNATYRSSAAQLMYNNALLACPLTWILLIIIAVIAAIYVVIGVINKLTGSSISATGVIVGALLVAVAFIWNLFLGLLDFILGIINALVNPWIAWINFFGNLFNDPIGSIIHLFGDFADNILGVIENIAKALDKVFGSNLAGSVQNWRNGLNSMVEEAANKYGNGSYDKVVDEMNLSSESLGLKRWAYGDAYKTGYEWGANFGKTSEEDLFEGIYDKLGDISESSEETANNTKGLSDTQEDLAYLRDIAERDIINRYTTAEIKIEQTNHNSIASDMDIDGIMDKWNADFTEILETAAEGVHA